MSIEFLLDKLDTRKLRKKHRRKATVYLQPIPYIGEFVAAREMFPNREDRRNTYFSVGGTVRGVTAFMFLGCAASDIPDVAIMGLAGYAGSTLVELVELDKALNRGGRNRTPHNHGLIEECFEVKDYFLSGEFWYKSART